MPVKSFRQVAPLILAFVITAGLIVVGWFLLTPTVFRITLLSIEIIGALLHVIVAQRKRGKNRPS